MDDHHSFNSSINAHQMSDQQNTDCVVKHESKIEPQVESNKNLTNQNKLNEQVDQQKNESFLDTTVLVKKERLNDDDERDTNDKTLSAQETQGTESKLDELEPLCTTNEIKQPIGQSISPDSYTDFGGVNLKEFLFNLLQTNIKDRIHLLKIEQELTNLIKDENRTSFRFPSMSSYHRMLVHRVAAYFGLEHNIDPKGNCVVVNKQEGVTRIPELRFKDQIKQLSSEEPKKLILKRNTNSIENGLLMAAAPDSKSINNSLDTRRTRSFEERNEHYEKVKARIFNQSKPLDSSQLSNIDECDLKCNSTKSNESLRIFNNSDHHNIDSGQSYSSHSTTYYNTAYGYSKAYGDNYEDFSTVQSNYDSDYNQFNNQNSNSQFDNQGDFVKSQSINKFSGDESKFSKPNGSKNKSSKINLKNSTKPTINKQHFYHPQPVPMLNSIDQQQLYTNWLPADLNAQQAECFAKQQIYGQPLSYNQLTNPNQQKLFLLCNYPETHSYSNDKIMPNQVVLPSNNANMGHINGQLSNNSIANKMDKENMNSYVTQMSNLSLGSMNPSAPDITDVQNRTSSGIPICYVKSTYYPMPASNQLTNDVVYQNSLTHRALHNQQMLFMNPNFNTPLNNTYNRPNSILPAPQQAITNQRFTNPTNYSYTVNGSTSHLEMNQMYPHMPPYIMPNTIRPQQSPLLPTPINPILTKTANLKQPSSNKHTSNNLSSKKINENQLNSNEINGFTKNERKKLNGARVDKRMSPVLQATSSIKPKAANLKDASSSSTAKGTNRSSLNNGLTNNV